MATHVAKIPPKKFPRKGAWCMAKCKDGSEALGIVADLGKKTVEVVTEDIAQTQEDGSTTYVPTPVKKDMLDPDAPFAEVHFVFTDDSDEREEHEQHGHTATRSRNIPFEDLRIAKYSEIAATLEARHSPMTAEEAAASGYVD